MAGQGRRGARDEGSGMGQVFEYLIRILLTCNIYHGKYPAHELEYYTAQSGGVMYYYSSNTGIGVM